MAQQSSPDMAATSGRSDPRRARTRARIIAAAFDLFGDPNGLATRIEDIARLAGVTRATFYNHFSGMEELREAVCHELNQDLLSQVAGILRSTGDAAQRTSMAVQLYMNRARKDSRWAWAMLNISSSGLFFGAETTLDARRTMAEGIADGRFPLADPSLARDVVVGITLAAIATQLREKTAPDFPRQVARQVLCGLGLAPAEVDEIISHPLTVSAAAN